VLGVAILTIDEGYNSPQALVAGLGAGLGFLLAMVLFSGVRRTLEEAEPPEVFKGMPITLIAAAITAMSFMGFSGVIDHLFGA
jgi:electron transport complex protein RnfA